MSHQEEIINIPTTTVDWPVPIPLLVAEKQALSYPVDALPPILRDAVNAYQAYGQQPLAMIACSALANVSLACQTLANVARDRLLVSPISVYFFVVAASGERKSAADRVFSKATRAWEQHMHALLKPEQTASKDGQWKNAVFYLPFAQRRYKISILAH